MIQMPHGKLEFLEGRQNGGVTNIKQGLVTAFGDDEKPPTSNAGTVRHPYILYIHAENERMI